jgi:hypothetical protein
MRLRETPGVLARRIFQADPPASAIDEVAGPVAGIVDLAGERWTSFPSRFNGNDGTPNLFSAPSAQHLGDDARGGALLKNARFQSFTIGVFFYAQVHSGFEERKKSVLFIGEFIQEFFFGKDFDTQLLGFGVFGTGLFSDDHKICFR